MKSLRFLLEMMLPIGNEGEVGPINAGWLAETVGSLFQYQALYSDAKNDFY